MKTQVACNSPSSTDRGPFSPPSLKQSQVFIGCNPVIEFPGKEYFSFMPDMVNSCFKGEMYKDKYVTIKAVCTAKGTSASSLELFSTLDYFINESDFF